jgi:DNA-binding GntR family transcriptional regulator
VVASWSASHPGNGLVELSGLRKADVVYRQLRQEVISGLYPPGAELSVTQLSQRFGVSKQPVMDALRRLQESDFVAVVPQVGVFVTTPTVTDAEDFYRVWSASEGVVAGMAADRRSDEAVEQLSQAVQDLSRVLKSNGHDVVTSYIERNRQIHRLIYEMAGSMTVLRLALSAWDRSDFLIAMSGVNIEIERMHEADAEHHELLDAIAQRKVGKARDITERHVLATGTIVVDAMKRQSAEQSSVR